MLERDIEQYLVEQVEARGGQAHKIKFIGRRGAPDRLVIFPGVTWVIELKQPDGRMSYHQKEFRAALPISAWYASLWSIEDVDRWLESL